MVTRIAIVAAAATVLLCASADAAVKWFYTPSNNISCEVSSGGSAGAYAYCQSVRQPRSVTLSRTGSLKLCKGTKCLGDGPENATKLAYGKSVTVGAFRCSSKTSGMRCVVVNSGRGFELSRTGVHRVG